MIFDLTKIDYSEEITTQLRRQHFDIIDEMIKSKSYDNKETKKVTVFHGTTLSNINNILLNGLLPRNTSGQSNFHDDIISNEHLVYLTNKWHYFYAYNTFKKASETGQEDDMNIPCYVECEIPVFTTVMDEDFFHSEYIKRKIHDAIRSKKRTFELSYKECLDIYGTVAHLGTIPIENIKSFTILGDVKNFYDKFIDNRSKYAKQLVNWGQGKGLGGLKLRDLIQMEDNEYNVTFWTENIPRNYIITGIEPVENGNVKYRLHFNEVNRNQGSTINL